jgi:hypothetical protein
MAIFRLQNRPLEPMDRIAEVLFGLIMVLGFTLSFSAAEEGHAGVHAMLVGAVGCNLAWGIIDAIMYLMACLGERGHGLRTLRMVRDAANPDEVRRAIAGALPELVADALRSEEYDSIRQRLSRLTDLPTHAYLCKEDWLGAISVFLLICVSTFPVVIPFLVVGDPSHALRISNGVAILMLFLTGHAFGRYAGYRPWALGFSMVLLGIGLVGITIALGG